MVAINRQIPVKDLPILFFVVHETVEESRLLMKRSVRDFSTPTTRQKLEDVQWASQTGKI